MPTFGTNSLRFNVQAFWLVFTVIAFLIARLPGFGMIFPFWIILLAIVMTVCLMIAINAVQTSRGEKYEKSPRELGILSDRFDRSIAIAPLFGLFTHRIGPIDALSTELSNRVRKAESRLLVAHYSRG